MTPSIIFTKAVTGWLELKRPTLTLMDHLGDAWVLATDATEMNSPYLVMGLSKCGISDGHNCR
jgi:hypothetical protein